VGDHEGLRSGVGASMFDYLVSAVVAVFLLLYLGWAMFKPEKF
jgi:K+-transporting ATPase KdpF subunit